MTRGDSAGTTLCRLRRGTLSILARPLLSLQTPPPTGFSGAGLSRAPQNHLHGGVAHTPQNSPSRRDRDSVVCVTFEPCDGLHELHNAAVPPGTRGSTPPLTLATAGRGSVSADLPILGISYQQSQTKGGLLGLVSSGVFVFVFLILILK